MECEAVCKIAAKLEDINASYRIISPYDAQRAAMENALKQHNLDWHNKCYNVDSFQGKWPSEIILDPSDIFPLGNEDDYIIISVVRSHELGFLKDQRMTNVMLTRCKRGMFIITSKKFMDSKGGDCLAGEMLDELVKQVGNKAWITLEDIEKGEIVF